MWIYRAQTSWLLRNLFVIFIIFQLICQRVKTIEALQERSEHDIKTLLASRSTVNQEELRRLMRAMHNLKKYTGKLFLIKTVDPRRIYSDTDDL